MKTLAAFITGLLLTITLVAQPGKIDSLKRVLNRFSVKNDTAKASILNQLSSEYSRKNPDTAIYFANEALRISNKAGYKIGTANSLNSRAWVKINMGRFAEGYEDYTEALKIFTETNDETGKANVFNGLGVTYGMQEQYTQALPYFLKALTIFENTGNTAGMASSFIKIGTLYQRIHEYGKSLSYFQKTLQLSEKTGDKINTATAYNNIASIYGITKQYDKCLQATLKSKQLAEELNSIPALANAYLNMGTTYSEINQLDLSDSSLRKALFYFKQLKNREQIARTYNNLGSLYFKKNKYDQAKEFLYAANYIASAIRNQEIKYDVYSNLAEINKAEGKFLSTSRYYEKLLALKDTLYDSGKNRSIENLKASYELAKKQLQIEQLKKENSAKTKQRNYFAIAIAAAFILMILLVISVISVQRKNNVLSKQRNELKDLNELKDKFFSILGHDLRSPIGNILMSLDLIGTNDFLTDEEKNELLEKLKLNTSSALETMDNMLSWGKYQLQNNSNYRKTVRVHEVVERVCRFLQDTANNKSIELVNKITEPIVATADENQLEFILRNILSNALKFSHTDGRVVIRARKLNGFTHIYIKDYGTGMTQEVQEKLFDSQNRISNKGTLGEIGSGLGLLLCKEFIAQNFGTLSVKSEEGEGTTFAIKLPA